jgi:peptidylprolyl isomerase/FKBP-type peptidyl-prolyl cis-trans isomerase SlyD
MVTKIINVIFINKLFNQNYKGANIMAVNNGDFVRVNFTGKIKDTDDVFDTTYDEIAQEAGIFDDNKTYKAIPIVVGGNHLLPAIEEAIIGLEEGETKHIEVDSDNAFGPRDPKMIQLVPMKEFKKQGMTPVRGMKITADAGTGKIISVNGGRVKVDFNHELAGKNLEYDVSVVEVIEDDEEKIKSMIELHYSYPNMDLDKTEIKIDGDKVSIKLDEITRFDQKSYMDVTFARFRISKDIWDSMDYEKVEFVDEFEKKVEEPAEEDAEE